MVATVPKKELSLAEKIFSITNVYAYKVVTLLGFKILKFRRKDNSLNIKLSNEFEMYHNKVYTQNIKNVFDVESILSTIKNSPEYMEVDSSHNYLNLLLDCKEFEHQNAKFNSDNTVISWEIRPGTLQNETIKYAVDNNKKMIFIGDGFLRSINTHADVNAQLEYKKGIAFTIDDLTSYFDATKVSRLEQMLNDKNLILTDEQKERARKCIDKIVETHLTKYNHQPIFEPKIGREGVEKVLVVDQSYGDMSIIKGLAENNAFEQMLKCAIKENPDADIIVKTHPDTMTGTKGGYYTELKPHNNIYKMTDPINPISIIKYVDKVYVCSSQFGFEALMCGKEVHTFGMPFYAGWGLTIDEKTCKRRTNTRTLEEIFYIAYIMYSWYVNPKTNSRCEIEDTMDYLLDLRDRYFEDKDK